MTRLSCSDPALMASYALALTPGTYDLFVSAPGYKSTPLMQRVCVREDEVARVDWDLDSVEPNFRGRVLGADEAPLGQAILRVEGPPGNVVAHGVTAARGEFAFFAPEGTRVVTVCAVGHACIERAITLPAEDVVFELEDAASLSGHVFSDVTGLPIAGASVTARLASVAPDIVQRVQVTADDEGAFRLDGLAAAQYWVSAQSVDGWLQAPQNVTLLAGRSEDINLFLTAGGTVTARLMPETSESGCTHLTAALTGSGRTIRGEYHDGLVRFMGVAPDVYRVRVDCEGYTLEDGRPLVFDGRDVSVEWKLVRALALRGVVLDDAGVRIQGARVSALSERGVQSAAVADQRGQFTLADLGRGRWTLSVRVQDNGPLAAEPVLVDVPSAEPLELRVSAMRTVAVACTPQRGRTLLAYVVSADSHVCAEMEQQLGGYVLHVPEGSYRVALFDGLNPPSLSPLTDIGESGGQIPCPMPPGGSGSVYGRVLDADGAAVSGARVQLQLPEDLPPIMRATLAEHLTTVRADPSGTFHLAGLSLEPRTVSASTATGEGHTRLLPGTESIEIRVLHREVEAEANPL